ncbi:MAG TPA: hypothetical protein V6C81_16015 [Planktothrix sp.]|jgi:hypothetical protein
MPPPQPMFKKGQLLIVKAPPFYNKEYFYEIVSAGGKQIRATLYHSPKVKKSWTVDELKLLIEHGVIRIAKDGEQPPAPSTQPD